MSYHDLSSCTLNDDQRREESERILKMLEDHVEQMTPTEAQFIERVGDGCPVSVKMLFWLRDLTGKYL